MNARKRGVFPDQRLVGGETPYLSKRLSSAEACSRLGFDDVDERPDLTEIVDHLCVRFARLVFIIEGVLEGLNLRVIERLN